MFLKSLKISKGNDIIRDIKFHNGINLIVDESDGLVTGNNVGKTTVLKLIDFCFGAKAKHIWENPENKKEVNKVVKEFLIENEILIKLHLTENLDDDSAAKVVIERNFLSKPTRVIRRINDIHYTDEEFEKQLSKLLFPEHIADKPTFRQIISHNIRYKDLSVNNTLKTLDPYTSDEEYETLHLFLLGCEFTRGNQKQDLLQKIRQENIYKNRLEKVQTRSAYETTLSLIENDIIILNKRKANLNINEDFESDLNKFNQIKYNISKISSEISKLSIRKDLIIEASKTLKNSVSNIDLQQLNQIYQQFTDIVINVHKSFEQLVQYHNQMIEEKNNFITRELPELVRKLEKKQELLKNLLNQEGELSQIISKSDSFEELENIISELNEKYRNKGEYENIIQQLIEVEDNIKSYEQDLKSIDEELFSDNFEALVKNQLNKFNRHFSTISDSLYKEHYALKYEITIKNGQKIYKFSPFNTNFSSGKKQGEVSCFDIAYILFADEENMPCMHFILNDKKELMHDNQLVKIAHLVNNSNIQFVASILRDKLPDELNNEDFIVLKLSEEEKLFKIEVS